MQSTANIKQANQWYTGNINHEYNDTKDIDWFRFDVTKKSYISVEMKTKREAKANLVSMDLFNYETLLETEQNTTNPYLKTKTYLVNPGTYYIRMMDGSYSDYMDWDYSIRFNQSEYIDLQSIDIPEEMKLEPGEKTTLNAVITPENASEKELEWSSDDTSIVSVDKSGNITARKEGTATITVCAKCNRDIKVACTVTVRESRPVSINQKNLNMIVGQNYTLKLANATRPFWKSSNTKIVLVAQNGRITAKGLGKAVVTSTYKGKKYTCTINVNLMQQSITSLKSPKFGSFYVKWKKDNGALGYQLQYSLNSKMSGAKTITLKNKNTVTKTISGLKNGKRYYFRVRSYGRSNGRTVYGKWGAIKSGQSQFVGQTGEYNCTNPSDWETGTIKITSIKGNTINLTLKTDLFGILGSMKAQIVAPNKAVLKISKMTATLTWNNARKFSIKTKGYINLAGAMDYEDMLTNRTYEK